MVYATFPFLRVMRKVYLIFFVVVVVLASCKYEEGPLLSFKSRDNRLMRTWVLQKRLINSLEEPRISYETVTFQKFGKFEAYYTDNTGIERVYFGGWNFLNNDEDITFNKTRTYYDQYGIFQEEVLQIIGTIRKLTRKELRISYYDINKNRIEENYFSE